MMLPDYWLARPTTVFGEDARQAFDQLLAATLQAGPCPLIHYTLPWPKWSFLCYLAEQHPIALHGSGNAEIATFEPRQSNDINEFGNQCAVYAAADGIWPMFFAIVNREQYALTVNNACIRLIDREGNANGPFYVFSISATELARQPWRAGTVYLLPNTTFQQQAAFLFGNYEVQIPQLASLSPVQPLARLYVAPSDFPFLQQIRGHDDRRLPEYATAMQTGAPWPAEFS